MADAVHKEAASEKQAEAVNQELVLLETTIASILEATEAAEESERLRQQAIDDNEACAKATADALQLQERSLFAIAEAAELEAKAEALSLQGKMAESMEAIAAAGRYISMRKCHLYRLHHPKNSCLQASSV